MIRRDAWRQSNLVDGELGGRAIGASTAGSSPARLLQGGLTCAHAGATGLRGEASGSDAGEKPLRWRDCA